MMLFLRDSASLLCYSANYDALLQSLEPSGSMHAMHWALPLFLCVCSLSSNRLLRSIANARLEMERKHGNMQDKQT